MRAFVATDIVGSFAFDEDGNLLEHVLFKKDPEYIADELAKARKGEIIEEEKL